MSSVQWLFTIWKGKYSNKVRRACIKYETETITIPKEVYNKLKKKAEVADDIVLQLESSLKDAEAGRIKRVA